MVRERLRFAPLIRVSTQEQDRSGSLDRQRQRIEAAIKDMGGKIPDTLTDRYTGTESATDIENRKILERLLKDCEKNLFDAIVVEDESRWSRDERERAVKILRKKDMGVRPTQLTATQ